MPLVAWRSKKGTREEAVAEVARRYGQFVDIFENSGPATVTRTSG